MASPRCPACRRRKFDGTICVSCGHDLNAPPPDVSGARLRSRIKARLLRRPVDTSFRANMPWRRPLLVAMMSAVVIGSGHLYCRDYKEGFSLMAIASALTYAWWEINMFALFFLLVIWNFQIFSAYDRAIEFDYNSIFKACERE